MTGAGDLGDSGSARKRPKSSKKLAAGALRRVSPQIDAAVVRVVVECMRVSEYPHPSII